MADTELNLDVRYEFERWMSQRGESAVYIGDGLYSTGAVCDQAEAFAAGVALARPALASRPVEVDPARLLLEALAVAVKLRTDIDKALERIGGAR